MTYTTPELVNYGKLVAVTNGGLMGLKWECYEDGWRQGSTTRHCP